MIQRKLTTTAAALTLALTATATLTLTSCTERKTIATKTPVVKTDTARAYGEEARLEFPGRVKAAEEVNLAFQVPGTLLHIYAEDGQTVRKGSVIAALDDRDYLTQLSAAEAEYNSIKADAERVIAMYEDNATTASNYDKARYGLMQITAKYENCKNQLADTKLTAPFNGKIQKHYYDAPAVVGAGMPVISLISTDAPEIEINIPASEYARFSRYTDFNASFDFIPGKHVALKLVSISPKANANQLYTVRLALTETSSQIAPGMNSMVSIGINTGDKNLTSIPSTALVGKGEESHVWVLDNDNVISSRKVSVVRLTTDGRAIISAGLNAGETVVTSGTHQIHEGEKVSILKKASSTNIGGLL